MDDEKRKDYLRSAYWKFINLDPLNGCPCFALREFLKGEKILVKIGEYYKAAIAASYRGDSSSMVNYANMALKHGDKKTAHAIVELRVQPEGKQLPKFGSLESILHLHIFDSPKSCILGFGSEYAKQFKAATESVHVSELRAFED